MSAYYNEHDPLAAAWLRELISDGLIADGIVDERSITDVQPRDLDGFIQTHFFAGIGGWSYALRLAGWPDDRPVWTGSCPCQPFSTAGKKRGTEDPRHLWPQFRRLIRQCRPPVVFGEQVASVDGRRWLSAVQTDLEALRYRTASAILPAAGVGAPHKRDRIWFVADTNGRIAEHRRVQRSRRHVQRTEDETSCDVANTDGQRLEGERLQLQPGESRHAHFSDSSEGDLEFWWNDNTVWIDCRDGKTRPTQRGIIPLVDGLPRVVGSRGDQGAPLHQEDARPQGEHSALGNPNATPEARTMRLRGYGNAIVPQVAALFIRAYATAVDA